jgi:N-acetylneuraminic acid mutarotase
MLLLLMSVGSAAGSTPRWTTSWTNATASPGPRYEAATTVLGGKVYAFGGYHDAQWHVDRTYLIYNPALDAWTFGGTLPTGMPETHLGITNDGRYIYFAGGFGGNIQNTQPSQWISDEVWRLDPQSNTWTLITHLPQSRGAGGLALIGRRLHYISGNPADRMTNMPEHFVYDLDTGKWSTAAPIPDPKDHFATVLMNGLIYVVGGEHGHDVPGKHQQVATVHVYDPATDSWRQLAGLPVATSHIEGSTQALDGNIVVAGGQIGVFDPTDQVFSYDPIANSWSKLSPSLPGLRQGPIVQHVGRQMVATLGAIQPSQPQTSTWGGQLGPPAAPVNMGAPTVAGEAKKGSTLRGHRGGWSGSTNIGEQWQRCTSASDPTTCLDIPSATTTSYSPTTADVGNFLRLVDIATDEGASAAAASALTAAVTDPDAAPPAAPGPAVPRTPDASVSGATAPGDRQAVGSPACGGAGHVRLRWTIPTHLRLRTVVVTVNGHRSATLRGNRRQLTVSLPDLPRAEKVVLAASTTSGRHLRGSTTFSGCKAPRGGPLRLR